MKDNRFGSKFQEILILLPNLNVSKRPYPCHALCRSASLGCVSRTAPTTPINLPRKGRGGTLDLAPWGYATICRSSVKPLEVISSRKSYGRHKIVCLFVCPSSCLAYLALYLYQAVVWESFRC